MDVGAYAEYGLLGLVIFAILVGFATYFKKSWDAQKVAQDEIKAQMKQEIEDRGKWFKAREKELVIRLDKSDSLNEELTETNNMLLKNLENVTNTLTNITKQQETLLQEILFKVNAVYNTEKQKGGLGYDKSI